MPPTTCATAPAGTVVTYTYDLAGRRTGVSDTSAAIQPVATPGSSIQYAASTTYDALNRPTGVSWTPAPTAATPASASSVAFTHSYNAVNQRTGQAVSDNTWISYPAATPATTSYTANNLNQYTAVGTASPTYDSNGNTTSDGTYTLGYDPENRLVSASGGGNTASYAFDGRGRRKLKTVNGTTTISITDAQNREVLEYDGSTGAILRWYAYGLGPNAVLNQMNVAAGTRATLVPDQLGSIIGSMDSGTATLTAFAYKPYGSSGAPPAQFGFTGQRFDAETGSYYYRARHYSPGWGRFLQVDPSGIFTGTSSYGYVGNDPLNSIDPTGMYVEVQTSGNQVILTLPIEYRGATPQQIAAINQSISQRWTNTFGQYDVTLNIVTPAANSPASQKNIVYITDDPVKASGNSGCYPSCVFMNGGATSDVGYWNPYDAWQGSGFAHEAGHLMGLPDYYDAANPNNLRSDMNLPPDALGSIMRAPSLIPIEYDIQRILDQNSGQGQGIGRMPQSGDLSGK